MVKSIVSILISACILLFGVVFENKYINQTFFDMHTAFCTVKVKIDDNTAKEDDVIAVQKLWLNKKKFLHAFIPHTEIKEVDLWLAETITLVRDKEWQDAVSKIEVLIELTEQVPETFKFSLGNLL